MLLLLAVLHQAYVTLADPAALYMDSLRLLVQLDAWQEGRLSLLRFWDQGPHRGLVSQLLLLGNVEWLSVKPLWINRLTGLVMLAVALVILHGFRKSTARGAIPPATWILALASWAIAWLCFSLANFEILVVDLGLGLWIKNLSFVAFFSLLGGQLSLQSAPVRSTAWWVGLSLFGAVIVLFIGMGWSYAFIGSLVAVQVLVLADRLVAKRPIALVSNLPALTAVAALVAYVAAGGGLDATTTHGSTGEILERAVRLLPYALGAPLAGVEFLSTQPAGYEAAYAFGLISLLMGTWTFLRRLMAGISSGPLLPIYLLGYGFLSAVSVCIARTDAGPAGVMASRYYMDLALFLVAVVWLWADEMRRSIGPGRAWRGVVLVLLCAVIGTGQWLTTMTEWRIAPYRAVAFDAMDQAMSDGEIDLADATLLQSPPQDAAAAVAVMEDRRLGVFAGLADATCDVASLQFPNGWYPPEPQGHWSSGSARLRVPACGCGFTMKAYLPPQFPGRQLTIQQRRGGIVSVQQLDPGSLVEVALPSASRATNYDFEFSAVTRPATDFPGNSDTRELGAIWSSPAFTCD